MTELSTDAPKAVGRRRFLRAAAALTTFTSLLAACSPAAPSAQGQAPAPTAAAAAQAQAQSAATTTTPPTTTSAASTTGAAGTKRKVILVPQDAGDWNAPVRVGCRDFCAMVGWQFQHIGNPVYSVENHVEQVNNAIATKPDIIITELENQGLVPAFQKAIGAGITMIIFDQAIAAEAAKLNLPVINQDEMAAGVLNGTQAATVAQKTLGKTQGVFGVGNGNPGAASIDARQNGTKQGIEDYNKANGTNFTTDLFADDEFFDANASIQKWGAKLDQYGDQLIGMLSVGGPGPIVKAAQTHNIDKGKIIIGSIGADPTTLDLLQQGWLYWGIEQQLVPMGFYSVAAAWEQLERGFPTKTIRVGGELVTKDNVDAVKARTDKWVALAKQYGDMS